MADPVKVELGAVQQTLFIPLAARARQMHRRRPVLHDPKAAEILASVDFDTEKYGRGWVAASPSCAPRFSTAGSAASSPGIRPGQSWRSVPG
jgi:O-methyltransferase involved in polyketide biosynthesis